ncbi:Cinnamoyl-CoA reductase protein [Dioscorea alata]|uniref:Cinnamoyl-CoA reductase protein n=1 Tax=Dioscorea alata TaxID=55571 RepID=A0ACB7UFQ9_DIOAL|nr:Cinnamoyl-CoA reductase protein [Dioscorea alata]
MNMGPDEGQTCHKTVCVMDVSGPLGSSLVDCLLNRGYYVHAATNNLHGALHDLKGLPIDNKRLKLFRSDPFDYQSIVDALKGCSGLFYMFEESIYDEFTAEIEVRAALNVLEACAQTETMERVVFTSSVTAVVWKEKRDLDTDVDERNWSDPEFCRKFKLWHALAKTLAEKTAWALAMDRGVDMVSINAGLLLTGGQLSPENPYLKGTPEMYGDGVLVTVDLKFLVDAHICVYENSLAFGRYLCFNHTVCRPEDAVKLAKMLVPSSPAPPPSDGLRVIQQRIQNKKLNKLMVDFIDEVHVDD